MYKFIVWNCHGAGEKKFPMLIKNMVELHNLKLLVVVEPLISGTDATRVIKKLGFSWSHRVEGMGFSGDI